MKQNSKKSSQGMTSAEYLEHLAIEERRSRLLAWLESDPAKKAKEQRKNRSFKKLIQYVKRTAGGGIETSDARALQDPEAPEKKKIIH